jgi:hypothetical protein
VRGEGRNKGERERGRRKAYTDVRKRRGKRKEMRESGRMEIERLETELQI